MKNLTLLLACLLAALLFTQPVSAQQRLSGTWSVEKVGGQETPKNVQLTFSFADNDKLTLTYSFAGEEAQSWDFTFTIVDGQLKLEPAKAFGEPDSVTYDIKFEEGKLLLLTPKPKDEGDDDKPAEGEDAKPTGDDAAATSTDNAGQDADKDASDKPADAAEADAADSKEADGTKEEEKEKTEEEKPDTREPVWVLVPAK